MRILPLIAVSLVSLAGCQAMYKPPYEVKHPKESETYTREYRVVKGYSGYEVSLGIPALGWIPVVGPYLSEMIKFRSGVNQDVIVPIMEESVYVHEARIRMGLAAPPASGLRFVPEPCGVRK